MDKFLSRNIRASTDLQSKPPAEVPKEIALTVLKCGAEIGDCLRALRIQANLNHLEVAEEFKMTELGIARLERNAFRTPLCMIFQIARHYGSDGERINDLLCEVQMAVSMMRSQFSKPKIEESASKER